MHVEARYVDSGQQCRRVVVRGLSRYKLPGPDGPEASPKPDYVTYFLSVSVVSLFVDLQINPFRPSPSHSATETVFPI